MKPALLDRVRYWCAGRISGGVVETELYPAPDQPAYLSDFGPNVPVENLGGDPVFYENGQPVYPGREHAP